MRRRRRGTYLPIWARAAVAVVGVVAALLGVPRPAAAQPPVGVARIGLLSNSTSPHLRAFEAGLRELGYVEGRNIVIERRSASGVSSRLSALADELVRLAPDVIVAPDPPSTRAARHATATIPIVTRSSDDPVDSGLVASLSRPGGNVTGVYSLYAALGPKRLELIKEALPRVTRVAVLWDPAFAGGPARWSEVEQAARALELTLVSAEARSAGELEHAFRTARRQRAEALITLRNPTMVVHKRTVIELAARSSLPAMYDDREFVEAGGLMSYGANLDDLYRRAAAYVDKILKGANPAMLPIERATTFELVLNLKTARALGLTVPAALRLRADRVVE